MPTRARRREEDHRADRLESEVRQSEMQDPAFAAKRKFMCKACGHLFEEKSRTCPRCEKGRTMGELKPIPERFLSEARRGAIRRARAGRGAPMPGQW